jgi:hypothetical protein
MHALFLLFEYCCPYLVPYSHLTLKKTPKYLFVREARQKIDTLKVGRGWNFGQLLFYYNK